MDLLDVYLKLLPENDIAVFWVGIADDWEEAGSEEIYTNEALNEKKKIADYISQNRIDTLENGHVTLTSYIRKGQTNINISDHKLIEVMTYDRETGSLTCETLEGAGLGQHEELVNVGDRFYHWHYRHPDGADRKELTGQLIRQGFTLWE